MHISIDRAVVGQFALCCLGKVTVTVVAKLSRYGVGQVLGCQCHIMGRPASAERTCDGAVVGDAATRALRAATDASPIGEVSSGCGFAYDGIAVH